MISEDGIYVPVPKGYVASTDAEERYVNGVTTDGVREHHGGFVIYEKNTGETDEQATVTIAANLNTAKTSRNQWVWVPVNDVIEMYHVTNGEIYGNRYSFSTSGYSKNTGFSREPALTVFETDSSYLKMYLEGISRNEFLQEMREEFYEMLESVATYGGFYIGRYETGNVNSKVPVVKKGNTNISRAPWYGMYKACKNLKGNNKSVQTGIIWHVQFCETLKWIVDSKDKTCTQIISNYSSWGNWSGVVRPTGYSDTWMANNVYDLAGNRAEYTMAAYGDPLNRRLVIGGFAENTGSRYIIDGANHMDYPYSGAEFWGYRASLTIR